VCAKLSRRETWLNIAFGLFAITLFAVVRRYPMQHGHREHHAHQGQVHHH